MERDALAVLDADVDDDLVAFHANELHVELAADDAGDAGRDDDAVRRARGGLGDEDGSAEAEVGAELAEAAEREHLAGLHAADVRDRARVDEAAHALGGDEGRLDEGADLVVLGGDDDARDELGARVEAEGDRGVGEAVGREAPAVREAGLGGEGRLDEVLVGAALEVTEADAVDLGAELLLAEASGEAADDRVEGLDLGDVGEDAVRVGAGGEDRRRVEPGGEVGGRELVVQALGREADGDAGEVTEVEALGVGPVGLQLGDACLVGAADLLVRGCRAGDRGESEEGGESQEGGAAAHDVVPMYTSGATVAFQ